MDDFSFIFIVVAFVGLLLFLGDHLMFQYIEKEVEQEREVVLNKIREYTDSSTLESWAISESTWRVRNEKQVWEIEVEWMNGMYEVKQVLQIGEVLPA